MKKKNGLIQGKTILGRNSYWNDYYGKVQIGKPYPSPPSQFAAFCLGELSIANIDFIVDIAFGDGRDASFFNRHGLEVHAIEKSWQAVDLMNRKLKVKGNLKIYQLDVVKDKIDWQLPKDRTIAFYSRFFIHTLTEVEVSIFFENLAEVMKLGDLFLVEYRNEEDLKLVKETPDHFRAFYKAKFIS